LLRHKVGEFLGVATADTSAVIGRAFKHYFQSFGWQNILNYFTPLDYDYALWVADKFFQLLRDYARFLQPVKIKVLNAEIRANILFADSKSGTRYTVDAARSSRQPTRKRRLAATQVTDEFYRLPAAQITTDALAELLGLL